MGYCIMSSFLGLRGKLHCFFILQDFVVVLTFMCFTVSSVLRRECWNEGSANDYFGTKSITVDGTVCQRWDQQYPHKHTR